MFGHSYASKRLAPVEVKFGHERPDYTIQDFRNDPEVVKDFETVIDYLETIKVFGTINLATSPTQDDDPVEFLRDDFMRVETALSKANALKMQKKRKSAYRRMRQKFDNAEVYDWSEQVHRVLDYGTDLIFNYENAAALGAAALSAGPTMEQAWRLVRRQERAQALWQLKHLILLYALVKAQEKALKKL